MKIITILLLLSISAAPPQPSCAFPKPFERKLQRFVRKNCGKSITITSCITPDMEDALPGRYIYTLSDPTKRILILSKIRGCHIGGCDSGIGAESPKYEQFWYAAIYDSNGVIQAVKVIDFPSEYGYEITAKSWLRQFKKKKGCNLVYGTKEVDAISGATVSAKAIVNDLDMLCWLFPNIVQKDTLIDSLEPDPK